jgi:2-oxoisovalerate dehydrogenase E1 component alpha subunit
MWADESDNPIHRFRAFLVSKNWWSEPEDAELVKKTKSDVMKAFTRAEKLPKPKLSEMFNDVWAVQPGEKVPTIIVSRP